jgi:hypothetical protein
MKIAMSPNSGAINPRKIKEELGWEPGQSLKKV